MSRVLAAVRVTFHARTPPDTSTCSSDAQVAETVKRFLALRPVPHPTETTTPDGAKCGARQCHGCAVATQGPRSVEEALHAFHLLVPRFTPFHP